MRMMLRDLAPGQDYAIQYRLNNGVDVTEWSQISRFRTDGDITAPAPVTGLTWGSSGSSFVAKWTAPTTDALGAPLRDFKDYQVIISAGATSRTYYVPTPTFEFTLFQNAELFGSIAATVNISVKARDNTGNLSTAATASYTESAPPVPATPTVSAYLGQLVITWNGNPASGVRNPISLDHVEVHVSTTSGFTPSESTMKARFSGAFPGPQSVLLSELAYGVLVYIKLVSVNRFGAKSTPSAQVSGTPVRISGLDIQDGQIGTAQINFTAYDIGGANAYYPASNAARDAIVGAKTNDIAYVTGTGYTTYRYNGTTWVAAPEIGVIQGSKILAGTVTSSAVGTNLLITTSANIGTAAIDSANIAGLNAAKITAGTMSADVIMSGRFATASTGARREVNSVGFQAFDASSNLTISLDGVNNLLTGIFKTSLSGRRIEIGAGGAVGTIVFYPATGTLGSYLYSYVSGGGTTENVIVGTSVPGAAASWCAFLTNTDQNTFVTGRNVIAMIGGTTSGSDRNFSVDYAPSSADPNTRRTLLRASPTSLDTYYSTSGDYTIWEHPASGSDIARMWMEGGGGTYFYYDNAETFRVMERQTDGDLHSRFTIDAPNFYFEYPDLNNRIVILDPPAGRQGDTSPMFQWVHNTNFGSLIFHRSTSAGLSSRLEFRDASNVVYEDLWAAAFTVSSSEATKIDIRDYGAGALEKIMPLKSKVYRRKTGKSLDGQDVPLGPEQIGFIAEEVPEEMLARDENGDVFGVDLYQSLTFAIAALQEEVAERRALAKLVETLSAKLDKIEKEKG